MKILVTGGAGYIGSVLTPMLLRENHEVTILDNFRYDQNSLLDYCIDTKLTVVRGDCRDPDILKKALRGKDVIIPLAALVGASLCESDEISARSTNLDAITLILAARTQGQIILFPNTNSGYGIGEENKFCTEESPLLPLTLYGKTKVEAEEAIMSSGNAIAFRLATVFGMSPRMRLDLLVNDFVYRAVTDRTVVVFQGHFKRNYIHIRDVARTFLHGIEQFASMKDQVYNVGLDEANLTKLELCEKIKGHLPEFVFLEAPIGEDPDKRDYIVSNEKIRQAQFVPRYTIDDGIIELTKGYKILRNSKYTNS